MKKITSDIFVSYKEFEDMVRTGELEAISGMQNIYIHPLTSYSFYAKRAIQIIFTDTGQVRILPEEDFPVKPGQEAGDPGAPHLQSEGILLVFKGIE